MQLANHFDLKNYKRVVKSTLVTLHPIEKVLEYLLELLPRFMVQVKLRPVADVSIVDESRGLFRSLGGKPCFELCSPEQIKAGWYYLEGSVVRHNGSRVAHIEVALEDSTNSVKETILVPTNLRGSVREVFYLPKKIKHVFWIPTEQPGLIQQGPLLFHRISSLESIIRRFYRVVYDHFSFRSNWISGNGLNVRGVFRGLQNAYCKSATYRTERYARPYRDLFKNYVSWLDKNKRQFEFEERTLNIKPRFTLIIKVNNPERPALQQTIEWLSTQIYQNWELIWVCNDLNEKDELSDLFNNAENIHSHQILYITPSHSQSETELFGEALRRAQGEFVLRMEQSDVLLPHALLEVAKAVNLCPAADFIYTDNDSFDHLNNPCCPQFKSGWNPGLLYSYNYIYRPVFLRRPKLIEAGGYSCDMDGLGDWEISLRYLAGQQSVIVLHIPLLLYRTKLSHDDSISGELPQCIGLVHCVANEVLQKYVAGESGFVEDTPLKGVFRVKYKPKDLPLVSIIIPTKDQLLLLEKCLTSLLTLTKYQRLEVILVDNQTSEANALEYLDSIAKNPVVRVLSYPYSFNWSAINNYAISNAGGVVIVLLNNDIEIISSDWLDEVVSHATRPDVGVVGAKLLYPDHSVQHAGVVLGLGGVAGHAHRFLDDHEQGYCYRANVLQNYSAVTGACMAFRREVYEKVDGFDERFAVAFNDIDFCLRVKRVGLRNVYTPYAKLIHHESLSRGVNDTKDKQNVFKEEWALMHKLWMKELATDEFYNPNLTSEGGGYSLSTQLARSSKLRVASV